MLISMELEQNSISVKPMLFFITFPSRNLFYPNSGDKKRWGFNKESPKKEAEWIGKEANRRSGSDLLSRVLRPSTMGAKGFNVRVRNGIGWDTSAITTRSSKCFRQRTSKGREEDYLCVKIKPIRLLVSVS